MIDELLDQIIFVTKDSWKQLFNLLDFCMD